MLTFRSSFLAPWVCQEIILRCIISYSSPGFPGEVVKGFVPSSFAHHRARRSFLDKEAAQQILAEKKMIFTYLFYVFSVLFWKEEM